MIELELPWPPSVNHYKRMGRLMTTKSGKTFQPRVNSDETRMYYHAVWVLASQLKARNGFKSFQGSTIDLEVIVSLHPPDKRRRDIDNSLKILLDSLQHGGLIDNDYQIARLYVERRDIIKNGKVIVRISQL